MIITKNILVITLLVGSLSVAMSQHYKTIPMQPEFSKDHVNLRCMDTIKINGKVYALAANPFYVFDTSFMFVLKKLYPEVNDFECPPKVTNRFYIATWLIRSGKLYLRRVEPDFNHIHIPSHAQKDKMFAILYDSKYWAKILPPNDSVYMRIERLTGRKFKGRLMFADWYSGTVKVMDNYNARDRAIPKTRIILTIENGVVIKQEYLSVE